MGREIQGDVVTDNLHYERAVHGEISLAFLFFLQGPTMDPNKNTTGGKTGVLAFLIRGRKKMKDEYRSSSIDAGANFGFFF